MPKLRSFASLASCLVLGATAVLGCGGNNVQQPNPNPGPQLINLNTGQAAAVVVGQADFAGDQVNQGGAAGANTSNAPGGSATGSLFIAEQFNNRILGFNAPPAANNANADFVLGQANFLDTSAAGAPSATKFQGPLDVCVSGGRLFSCELFTSRVLIWNAVPAATNVPANVAVGQPDLTTGNQTTTQTGLNLPEGVCVAGDKLVVADRNNDRVMIWSPIPAADGAAASLVLGQALFTTQLTGNGANQMLNPRGVWTDGVRVAVADTDNNRVLIWTSFPVASGQAADLVVGQAAFGASGAAAGNTGMNGPRGVTSNGTQLFVADTGNNRVLVYNAFPAANGTAADAVLGQATFAGVAAAAGSTGMSGPEGVHAEGNQLFVSDTGNHRTLIFNGN